LSPATIFEVSIVPDVRVKIEGFAVLIVMLSIAWYIAPGTDESG
jgi:hypothetical protein